MAKENDGRTFLVEMEKMPENTGKGKRSNQVKLDKDFGSSQDQERLKRGKNSRRQDDYSFKSAQLLPEEVTY